MQSKCSLSFHELANELFNEFSTGVKSGIFGNPLLFPSPPVSEDAFELLIDTFVTKLNEWNGGGIDQRGPFNDAKTALMEALDDYAAFVDGKANGNETIIVAGGFKPTKTTRQPKPVPEIPTGVEATIKGNRKIETICNKMENAEFYGAIISKNATSFNSSFDNGQLNLSGQTISFIIIDTNKDRVKEFTVPAGGENYYIQYYCGNSKGTTLLSEPIRIMATE